MGIFFDLHRHDECSFFDGFGNPKDLAKHAKEIGYPALGLSNHGNITGLVRHWKACKDEGIKPVMGCEVYFQPVFTEDRKKYHLCLFVKNMTGYKNLCHILTCANVEKFYYSATVDFALLEKYHEGLICTSACIASATSRAIINKKVDMAEKLLCKFQEIFREDFYIEIQPYKIDSEGTQQKTDYVLMQLAKKLNIKCVLTSDSHYCKKEDFDTYCKMHEIGKTTLDVKNTYGERYMPTEKEIITRFVKLYKRGTDDLFKWANLAEGFVKNMQEIYDKIEDDILSDCPLILPKDDDLINPRAEFIRLVKEGLKKRGKFNKRYLDRCKKETNVIFYHKFEDYFLIVQDYVNYAKKNGIAVGDGRGSACNCLVAYALGITEVDSIRYNLDFSRFMRKEKKSLPDIDVDFETDKRQQVIDYAISKNPGRAVQICSYGEYKVDNLVNDLAKVCGLPTDKTVDESDRTYNKNKISEIKKFIKEYEEDGKINCEKLLEDYRAEEYNAQFDDIIKHFCKMYGKIRHLGKHAAGVAVVGSDISDYTCLVRQTKDGNAMYSSCFDKDDLETINCTKFDMLGLKTLSELFELETLSGHKVTEKDLEEKALYDAFREGKTDGIFQMEKKAPKKILGMIKCDCIEDVIAVNALNRPAPLQLKMHETYAYNKLSGKIDTSTPYYQYTKETYGTMLYQEQTVEVAQKLGHLTPEQSFDLLKIMKKPENLTKQEYVPKIEKMRKDFAVGCKKEGLTQEQTESIWASMLIYGFNKGHSVGYALIAVKQMWYKLHYPTFYWYVKMRYAGNDADLFKYSELAVKDGCVVLLPHVNATAYTSIKKMDGDFVIQQGISILKDIGSAAAESIEAERKQNGNFCDYDDFYDRCKGRSVTKRVIDVLEEHGALQFDKKKYYKRVIKYNGSLLGR